jgi:hypothetical protein
MRCSLLCCSSRPHGYVNAGRPRKGSIKSSAMRDCSELSEAACTMTFATLGECLASPFAANLFSSSISAMATVFVGLWIFRRQDRKMDQIRDVQFMMAHRKTLSELLEPIVSEDRKHVFHSAELLTAIEQAAYVFNRGLVGTYAREHMHAELTQILKVALGNDVILGFVRQNEGMRSYDEIHSFVQANRASFAGELRAMKAGGDIHMSIGGPGFSLDPLAGRANSWRSRRRARRGGGGGGRQQQVENAAV